MAVMVKAGDRPGAGIYRCTVCGRRVTVADDADVLIACPQCRAVTYLKVK